MKKSKVETAETRRRIVQAAAQAFKNNGIQATGIADVMAAAGMTHGGFYRHFASKEDLVAEACAAGMESARHAIDASAQPGDGNLLEHVEAYLWDRSGEDCIVQCPLIAMGSELARADIHIRHAATRGYLDLMGVMSEKGSSDIGDAIFAFSALLGAVTVSRIVDDPELATQVLRETKRRLAGVWPKTAANEDLAAPDAGQVLPRSLASWEQLL